MKDKKWKENFDKLEDQMTKYLKLAAEVINPLIYISFTIFFVLQSYTINVSSN